jgi:hypothetical protein
MECGNVFSQCQDFFSSQVLQILLLYNLLDETLYSSSKRPPFTAAYLEEPRLEKTWGSISMLLKFLGIAERLATTPDATEHCVASLYVLAAPNIERVHLPSRFRERSYNHRYKEYFQAAAVHLDLISIVRTIVP